MYLARKRVAGLDSYVICESYPDGDLMRSRELFNLGPDPSRYVIYTGRIGYYLDDEVVEGVRASGADPDPDLLEELFWPFLKPRLREVIGRFAGRKRSPGRLAALTGEQIEEGRARVHHFDKLRLFYLRYGYPPPRSVPHKPLKCFDLCLLRSRDEIEHRIMALEGQMRPGEYKGYVFSSFDLFRFFPGHLARLAPAALDPVECDDHFMEELCRLNTDAAFFEGGDLPSGLSAYLRRYAIMYFDHEFPGFSPMDAYIRDFINRRRAYRPPKKRKRGDLSAALKTFGLTREQFSAAAQVEITKIFRKKALKLHPDRGGEHEEFVGLTEAYEILMELKEA